MATVTPTIPNNKEEPIRKRTRATAEQLAVLEDTFAVNVSPNSKIRKQLADQLKMTDRSIQIWFQNRRAKVKHMQKRAQLQMHQANMRAQLYHYQQQHYYLQQHYAPHQRAQSLDSYNYHRSTASPHFDATSTSATNTSSLNDLGLMGQQRQSVPPCLPYAERVDLNSDHWALSVPPPSINNTTIDPTHLTMGSSSLGLSISSLTIGRWHRLKMQPKDLECVYQRERQLLCWNIVDGSHHFKMEIPVASIQQLTYTSSPGPSSDNNSGSSSSITTMTGSDLHLDLYHSPLFYMKHQQEWISCSDFTEHQQASQVLHHTLKGIGLTLWQELSMLMATCPETQHWIQLAPSPSFSSSSVSGSSVSSLNGLADDSSSIPKNDYKQQQQQHTLLPPQTIEMTPTLSTSESSSTSSSSSSSSNTLSTSSSLPVSKCEDPFMTLTPNTLAADDFLIDPSLLDPTLWSSTGFMAS